MKAKNNLKRNSSSQKQSSQITASRAHSGKKAPSGASSETGVVNSGLRKVFILKRHELSNH